MHPIDLSIIILYLIATIFIGFWISKRASKNLNSYFLGENKIHWSLLGLSNASGMFDISGTMWMVTILFVYGLKSAWLPWLWPVWNQVFIMVFLAIWLRRSNVLTGAQWITHRFGNKRGARLSHIIVTIFAVISVLGFIAYFFVGIGKFATIFFPWDLSFELMGMAVSSEHAYALSLISITTLYVIKGGIYSVVFTEVLQFVIMTIACLMVGYIAYHRVNVEEVLAAVPAGWDQVFFSWKLDLDWSQHLASVNDRINSDGFELFGYLFMMMLFKGIFASLAGPVPSYDMQRVLSAKDPKSAAKMGGLTIVALLFPRYLMVAGFAMLAIGLLMPEFQSMGQDLDLEVILPMVLDRFIPVGLKGLLLAGLLAAFMGTFAAFINSAPAYLINDLYKKYINPNASDKTYVRYSYVASVVLVVLGLIGGLFADSINSLTLWITSALYGGYAAANVLKWVWWRFNGYGYFFGMLMGLVASTIIPNIAPEVSDIYLFPWILLSSLLGSIIGTLATKPTPMEDLAKFHQQTYPWGFWKPVVDHIKKDHPKYEPNRHLKSDALNVVIGIVWQMSLTLLPIYLLLRDQKGIWITLALIAVSTFVLKKNWYDRLDELSAVPDLKPKTNV